MHAPNGCCILNYLLVDIKEDVGIMFKNMSQTPAFSSSMAAYSGGTKNLLAVNHCDLEVTPSLSKCLQLHLSCLTRTTLAWATNIWITKILGWTSTGRKIQIIFHAVPAQNAAATVSLSQKPEQQTSCVCCGVTFMNVT